MTAPDLVYRRPASLSLADQVRGKPVPARTRVRRPTLKDWPAITSRRIFAPPARRNTPK